MNDEDEVEEGEVKSDEEKRIDNSDRINDGLEDEEAPKTTSKTGRRLKNNKKRRGNKRHYYEREDDEENNPFDELDPKTIELKIKALKSLLAKNSSSSSSKKRLVKIKSPKTIKRNWSNRGESDNTNDRDFYLELGRRNLEKVNMCIFDEQLMRGKFIQQHGNNYKMELDLPNRQQFQQQPIFSCISAPQPQPSIFAQLNSMFPFTPNIPTHFSNYSTTLEQTQLNNYYQKTGQTSLLPSWQSTNGNENNTNLSSLHLIDANSVAITRPPQRATNMMMMMMMKNQRQPQQQQLNHFRNYGNKNNNNKRLNQNLNLNLNRRQMELAIRRNISQAKSVERSQSVDEKQKQLEKKQHNEKQRRWASKEKSDEEKEREMFELRRKLIENMNECRLLKKQQEAINSNNEKQASSEVAAKKAESSSVKPNTAAAAVTNVSTMNEDMSYFKKQLLEHEQVLSKSTSQSQQSGNKKIDRILIRINPNDDDDDEDSDDESLSTDDDDEKILMARKEAVLSSKLSTTKTLLQQSIGQFLEQAKRMALMTDAHNNNKPANNQTVKPAATVNNEPTKQMISPTTVLNSTHITSEKDKENLIKELRDRINQKSKLIAELAKRSSELQELTSRKEKDIDVTKKEMRMLREQLQAAEKILAVNERSLSSFKAEKSKIDTKLVSMQYEKSIQQVQLHNVLVSISTTTPTSNPTTTSLVAAKTMANTSLTKTNS